MNENTIIEQLTKWNEQLSGLPSGVLVFMLVCLASYLLKWWRLFPDKYVAPVCTFGGMILFCLLVPYAAEHMRIWITKNAILGFIISGAASVAVLRFGDRIPLIGRLLKPSGNTEFLAKPNEETKP